ncbi:MAG: DUF2085 domain-containing protein [Clostridiales bacterium]|nr:DUF2085 domain-containing protein [Clostridiales bacterium]
MDKKTKRWIKAMELAKCTGCHQMPERSFFYKGWQFPVCARCTGVFIGQIMSYFMYRNVKKPIRTSFMFCEIMLIDWLIQKNEYKESTNPRRLVTGILGGFGLNVLYIYIIKNIFKSFKFYE